MFNFNWHQHENRHTASLGIVRAIIVEDHNDDMSASRIETVDGTVLQAYDALSDFETAEEWVAWAAVVAEQMVNLNKPFQMMFDTFDRCVTKLALVAHPTHIQRIINIREWIASRRTQDKELSIEWQQRQREIVPTIVLEWQAVNDTDWSIDTPHGRAFIRERRSEKGVLSAYHSITHTAWIEHPSGATYNWQTSSIDFLVADQWIQQTLRELDDPRVAEALLGSCLFTLSICDHVLRDEADPMHRARIAYIKDTLEAVLP